MAYTATEQKALELLQTTNLFCSQIATQLRMSSHTVRKLRRTLSDPETENRIRLENELHEQAVQKGLELIRQGHTTTYAAKTLGVTRPMLYARQRRAGIRQRYEEKEVYIYGLCCPISKQVHYVGSSENPWTRYHLHLTAPVSALMSEWITCLSSRSMAPELRILSRLFTNDWLALEQEWIRRLADEGHPVMNREASNG